MTEQVEENTRPRVRPGVAESVDGALLLGTSALAVLGLAPTFTGVQFLLVGLLGLLVGMALSHVAASLRWPLVAPVLLSLGTFYLLGPLLCLRGVGLALPTPAAWGAITDQLLFGWKDLLTTLPPVDGDGPLLVLPWVLGLAAGVAGTALARVATGPAWLRAVLPVTVPAGLLAVVILLGVAQPQSVWLQGAAFSALALGWLAVRAARSRIAVRGGHGRVTRVVSGAVLVGLAAAAAMPLTGGAWPARGERAIWRTQVEPPFDIGQYPSPLSSFRRYVDQSDHPDPENLYTKPLFSLSGVAPGTRVRFATLDAYDGTVWGASNNAIPGAANDTYQRVSDTIDNPVQGQRVTVDVVLDEGYSGVWLPVVGALQHLDFVSGDTAAKRESFRFNLAASTAVVPSGLPPGDRDRFSAVLPDDRVDSEDTPRDQVGAAADAAAFLAVQADEWAGEETTPMRRVFAVAAYLRQGGQVHRRGHPRRTRSTGRGITSSGWGGFRERPGDGGRRRAVRRHDGAPGQPARRAGSRRDGRRRARGWCRDGGRRLGVGGTPGGRRQLADPADRGVHGRRAPGQGAAALSAGDVWFGGSPAGTRATALDHRRAERR
ncbi:MAG: transglutaminaseTgpA domain-containing protein [Nocardioides sp.]